MADEIENLMLEHLKYFQTGQDRMADKQCEENAN
jgi:hypothetical protein